MAFFIPLAVVPSMFAEKIFMAMGQDTDVSLIAAQLLRIMLGSSFFFGQFDL